VDDSGASIGLKETEIKKVGHEHILYVPQQVLRKTERLSTSRVPS
jgi:hypothetical protein